MEEGSQKETGNLSTESTCPQTEAPEVSGEQENENMVIRKLILQGPFFKGSLT